MRRSMHRTPLVVLIALAVGACGGATTTTGGSPTTPTVPTTTETFTGDLNPNGARTYSFTTAAGTITAALTTVSPDSTIAIGLSLGTWNGSACKSELANDNAVQGAVLTALASPAGSLCARVYDVGKLVDPITFTVTIVHP